MIIIVCTLHCGAQDGLLKMDSVGYLVGKFRMFEVDVLGNIYTVGQNDQLRKYSQKGDSLGIWNDIRRYGKPTALDVSNPMRVLIFFQPFSTVVLLDRLLTFRHAINLRKSNIFSASCIGNAYDNRIWVFDELEYRLKKLDDDGRILFESADWRLLFDRAPTPQKVMDHRNELFFVDSARGLYVFDYYGSFRRSDPAFRSENSGISRTLLYGFQGDSLSLINPEEERSESRKIQTSVSKAAVKRIQNGKLYVLEEDGIRIFQLSN